MTQLKIIFQHGTPGGRSIESALDMECMYDGIKQNITRGVEIPFWP